jgi:Ca2+-binding RTX toxin-like protein
MDLDGVESTVAKTLGGADELTVNDLSGTSLTDVKADLSATGGGDDAAADNVIVNGTPGDDVAVVSGAARSARVAGLSAGVSVSGAVAGSDRLRVNALAGDDVIDASGAAADTALLTLDGGADDDVLIGGAGPDTLLGGPGDDVLIGGPGNDTLDGGTGDNVVIQSLGADVVRGANVAGVKWLDKNARTVKGKTVFTVDGEKVKLPRVDLKQLTRGASVG